VRAARVTFRSSPLLRADRRVTCYYFYVWDDDLAAAFVKVCTYFPYPAKIYLLDLWA
jgi:hypothetical protein